MKKLGVIAVLGVATVALALPAGGAGKGGETKVICLTNQGLQKEYRERPHSCIFHRRHSPKAEAFFVRTKRDHWRVWKRDVARGRGREVPPMGLHTTPVRIRLFDSVHRCGHRVFSKAHFFFPQENHGSTLKIDTCA
jgi:hypothetical protein